MQGKVSRLPQKTGDAALDRSVAALRAYFSNRQPPGLGTLAKCIANVGCRLADAPENDFAEQLDVILTDRNRFCSDFPKKLIRYVHKFRNNAAHVDRMSLADYLGARSFLLEEPTELLLELTRAFVQERP
jgi:hypothetical protein